MERESEGWRARESGVRQNEREKVQIWGRLKKQERETWREKLRWNEREIKWMCEKKSKRPTSVTHYPPGPLSGNRSIWHNSQQTSLWLQMGVYGRGVKVIQGKDAKGTTDVSHWTQRNRKQENPLRPRSTLPLKGNSSNLGPIFPSQFLENIPIICTHQVNCWDLAKPQDC